MKEPKFEMEYLGAFLHDVGKFAYRAGEGRGDHEERGKKLIGNLLFKIKVLSKYRIISEFDFDDLENCIQRGTKNIQKADQIAAEERIDEFKSSRKTLRPLVSILSRVRLPDGPGLPKIHYYSPDAIEFKVKMPKPTNLLSTSYWELDSDESSEFREQYSSLFDEFVKNFEMLQNFYNFRTFFTTLFKVFERFTGLISSASYVSSPDISLFDHSRVVAALTSCFRFGNEDKPCLFVKGDISGIQKFIFYDIEEANRAAKQLRGRSFYVKLLADTVANYIVRELGLYDANILYCSGGHFLLLVPNNGENNAKINEIEAKINRALLKKFGGVLQLVLSKDAFEADDVGSNFSLISMLIEHFLKFSKMQKSFSILEEIFDMSDIDVERVRANEDMFIEIGKNLVKSDYIIEIVRKKNSKFHQKNEIVIDFEEFHTYYAFGTKENVTEKLTKIWDDSVDYFIVHNIRSTDLLELHKLIFSNKHHPQNFPIGLSFKFVGSFIPSDSREGGRPLTFEELAEGKGGGNSQKRGEVEEKSEDFPLLGVAKMDVDNLGNIFKYGLNTPKADKSDESLYSISRFAMLSRELDRFFCGHINTIAEKHNIYLVYSGGDDLFAVGKWTNIINFVQSVRKEFEQFACGNQNLTISCGTVFVKPNYPVARFAREANEQLEKAKSKTKTKNQVSIFYREVFWKELDFLLKIGELLYNAIKDDVSSKKLPRSFVHNLLTLTQQCLDENGRINVEKVNKVVSKLYYAFARREIDYKALMKNEMTDREKEKELQTVGEEGARTIQIANDEFMRIFARYFIASEDEFRKNWYENFQIPASYVILKTRKLNK